jgi:16S rRNA (adenine1518-N6/adenine1519-N6)-dimethyltransferase
MGILTKIKEELSRLGIQPKKSLGQNFLINEGIYTKIIDAVETKKGETVLEIGPGMGILTEYLAKTEADIIGIEKDGKLANYLKTKFASPKNVKLQAESRTKSTSDNFGLSPFGARVKIIEGDILEFDIASLGLKDGNYKVVGNIPYYITSHLLKTIFENWPKPKTITLMVQKEVAQRIRTKPPEMNLLAVSVQYYAEAKIISYVSNGSFYPSPDVDSAVIKLTPHVMPDSATFQKQFFKVAKAGFAGKRKQLINNLSRGMTLEKDEIQKKLASVGVDPQRRAETLTIEEWRKITKTFYSQD